MPSIIFWGPPGTGKTIMAGVVASELDANVYMLSGVTSTKKELMDIIRHAQTTIHYGERMIVFLDEMHSRNKAQQDTLLLYGEDGTVILTCATTENPSFTVNNVLLSRCAVACFVPLTHNEIAKALLRYREEIQKYYPNREYNDDIATGIARHADGDLRRAISILESMLIAMPTGKNVSGGHNMRDTVLQHDKDSEHHYNIISAIHKSLRDGDPDTACYRVQRMLYAGDDPLYIALRLLRFASEDIGIVNNNALLLANTVYDAVHKLDMPECDTALMQLIIYLAQSPKSNTCYRVANQTANDVHTYGSLPVPMVIRNAPAETMRMQGYGEGYIYVHDDPDGAANQQHMPDELVERTYGIE